MAGKYYLLKTSGEAETPATENLSVVAQPAPSLLVAKAVESASVASLVSALPEEVFLLGELLEEKADQKALVRAAVAGGLFILGLGLYLLPHVRRDLAAFLALLVFTPVVMLSAVWVLGGVLDGMRHGVLRPEAWRTAGSLLAFGFGVAGLLVPDPILERFLLVGGALAAVGPVFRVLPKLSLRTFFRGLRPLGGGYAVSVRDVAGAVRPVPIHALSEGDTVVFETGDMVPVECVVTEGEGSISYAGITAVMRPSAGATIHPGALVDGGKFTARVVKVPGSDLVQEATSLRIAKENAGPDATVLNLISVLAAVTVLVGLVYRVRFVGMTWQEGMVMSLAAAGALPLEGPALLFRLLRVGLVDAGAVHGLFGRRGDYLDAVEAEYMEVRCPLTEGVSPIPVHADEGLPGDIMARLVIDEERPSTFVYPPQSGRGMDGLMLLSGDVEHVAGFLREGRRCRRMFLWSSVFVLVCGGAAGMLASVRMVEPYQALGVTALALLWAIRMMTSRA